MRRAQPQSFLLVVLKLAVTARAAFLLLRETDDAEPPARIATDVAREVSPEVRLEGASLATATPQDIYRDADVATTLSAFRFQPPNVAAGAVSRLREHVAADPGLLEHLVRAALTEENLRAEYVEPDYPYDGRSLAIWAVEGLGRIAVPSLAARLERESDARRRGWILGILRGMGPEAAAAVPALIRHLRDTSVRDRERGTTIMTLALLGPEAAEVTPVLLPLLRDPDDPLFDAALRAIYPSAGMTDGVRDTFVDLLAVEDDDLRVDVLQVVVHQMGEDVEALRPTLVSLIEHDQPDVRRMALWALGTVGVREPAAIGAVGRRMEEGEEDEEAAALALPLASGELGREELLDVARRTDFMALALRAITVLQEDVATAGDVPPELLLRLFRECDAHLLNGVEGVLLAHPSGLAAAVWLPTLRAELHDLESDRRRAATLVLPAVRGDDEAVLALLREALRDEAVRVAGIEALGRMARLAERVVPLLEAEVGRRPHAAIEALGRMALEAPHARGALSRLTSAEDPEIRAAAVDVLSQVDEAYAAR